MATQSVSAWTDALRVERLSKAISPKQSPWPNSTNTISR
jgi:hypothetical protein